ncbi:MAG: NAD(P)H-binding protein [Candidatus Zixiibacteriota bacterium]
MTEQRKSALILGATGLVGKSCLDALIKSDLYLQVIAVTRRPLTVSHPKLRNLVVDFDNLEPVAAQFRADDIFCAFGTTIQRAGSKEAFRKIDHAYPLSIAELAVKNGAKQFILVSAVGANPMSSVFYLKVKGDLESAVAKLPFSSQLFFRTAMLDGEREEKRLLEELGIVFSRAIAFLLVGKLRKYRAVKTVDLALAMLVAASQGLTGVHIFDSGQITQMAAVSN